MKRRVFLSLLIACWSFSVLAQEKPKLFSNIERVFHEKEPSWKVERIYPNNTSEDIVFRSGKNQASVQIAIWKTEKEAEDVFAGESLAFDNTAGKKQVKTLLPKLGDENHIWTNRGSTAWPTIKFRKKNVNVTVFAPSLVVGKRFAQYVLQQIDASEYSSIRTSFRLATTSRESIIGRTLHVGVK
jgi:hypothetical protein